jgi:two-component system sensor histidine kinase TctE
VNPGWGVPHPEVPSLAPFSNSNTALAPGLELLRSVHRERLGEAIARSVAHALRDVAQVVDVIQLTASRGVEGMRAHDLATAKLREALLAEISLLEAFALTERQRITPLSLADVADVAVRLARRAIGPTPITLTSAVPRTLPPAIGIAGDVAEAFYAVLANAIEAVRMQGGGEIVLRGEVESDAVVVRIADNGPGVPEVLRDGDRMFDAFVSGAATHAQGIGLPVARDLIRRHGGDLLLEDEHGAGAVFLFRLPLWRRSPAATIPARRP